ncbi:uncharacterized protein ATNIH1004_005419 [Aspergillus tanneri]|uniref:Uncharacterized protein n=1 Tax=Aspergillus tanneri TaxID=1220188 RepID=A0A5M9MMT6_9EURO|nr:uncharacterized protein ATNIH1004_005419 [Aspergillus tanneri]KAA8646744.1 hypothetical protein ATNIH1004_005419 [Aspergillus tanneri]
MVADSPVKEPLRQVYSIFTQGVKSIHGVKLNNAWTKICAVKSLASPKLRPLAIVTTALCVSGNVHTVAMDPGIPPECPIARNDGIPLLIYVLDASGVVSREWRLPLKPLALKKGDPYAPIPYNTPHPC